VLNEHKPVVNIIKTVPPKMTALPVYSPTNPVQSRGVKSPMPVLNTPPPQPKIGGVTVVRPVVSPPLVPEDRKRKADQMTANTPEMQYKRRVVQALQIDAKSAGQPALTPFLNCEDVLTRLLPFHIFQPVDHEALVDGAREEELQSRYQRLLDEYHSRSSALTASASTCGEETLLMERLLWSEQREELNASRELLNKYLAQLQQQRQLQQQLLLNSAGTGNAITTMHGPAGTNAGTPLTPGAVKVLATTPHTAPRPPLNVAVMSPGLSPGLGKTGLLSAQTMALIQKVAHQGGRPGVMTPVNVVSVPPALNKEDHVINLLPQNKS
jgi:hypothetical protein